MGVEGGEGGGGRRLGAVAVAIGLGDFFEGRADLALHAQFTSAKTGKGPGMVHIATQPRAPPQYLPHNKRARRATTNPFLVTGRLVEGERRPPLGYCNTTRESQLHTYAVGGGLMTDGHRDHGSVLTLSVLLSPSAQGGEMITWRYGAPVTHRMHGTGRWHPIKLFLFHSEKVHSVRPVERG